MGERRKGKGNPEWEQVVSSGGRVTYRKRAARVGRSVRGNTKDMRVVDVSKEDDGDVLVPSDMNDIEWEDAPHGFDQSGTLYNAKIAEYGDHVFVVGLDANSERASVAMGNNGWTDSTWVDSSDTRDWPAFDRVFGRKNWQKWLDEYEKDSREQLHEDDE